MTADSQEELRCPGNVTDRRKRDRLQEARQIARRDFPERTVCAILGTSVGESGLGDEWI